MRKIIILFTILAVAGIQGATAQNLQLHYKTGQWLYPDSLGSDARILSTAEMFHVDAWGDTFFFIDMTYTPQGINYAYWEIARNLRFWDVPVALHLEYNGGLMGGILFNNAYMAGVSYAFASRDGTRNISVALMYKYIQGLPKPSNYQFTTVWGMDFAGGKCTFAGFLDFWRQSGTFVLLSQPQFWVNLNAFKGVDDDFGLSLGTEIELSNNLFYRGFYVVPTIAAKWTFR